MNADKEDNICRDTILLLLLFLFSGGVKSYIEKPAVAPTIQKTSAGTTQMSTTRPPTEGPTTYQPTKNQSTNEPNNPSVPLTVLGWTTGAIATIALSALALARTWRGPPPPPPVNPILSDVVNNVVNDQLINKHIPPNKPVPATPTKPPGSFPVNNGNLGVELPETNENNINIINRDIVVSNEIVTIPRGRGAYIEIEQQITDPVSAPTSNPKFKILQNDPTVAITQIISELNIRREKNNILRKNVEEIDKALRIYQTEQQFKKNKTSAPVVEEIRQELESLGNVDIVLEDKIAEQIVAKENDEYQQIAKEKEERDEQERIKLKVINDFRESFLFNQNLFLRNQREINYDNLDELFNEFGSIVLADEKMDTGIMYDIIANLLGKTTLFGGVVEKDKNIITRILKEFIVDLKGLHRFAIDRLITKLKTTGFQNWGKFKDALRKQLITGLTHATSLFIVSIREKFVIDRLPAGFNDAVIKFIKQEAVRDIDDMINALDVAKDRVAKVTEFLSNENNVKLFFETFSSKLVSTREDLRNRAILLYNKSGGLIEITNINFYKEINNFLTIQAKLIKNDPELKELQRIFDILREYRFETRIFPKLDDFVYESIADYNKLLHKILTGGDLTEDDLAEIKELSELTYIVNLNIFLRRGGMQYIDDLL